MFAACPLWATIRNCSCMKNGTTCQNCAPQRSGQCDNRVRQPQHVSSDPGNSASITISSRQTNVNHETTTDSESGTTSQDDTSSQNLLTVTNSFPDLQPPNFTWNSGSGEIFCPKINTAYEEVVHWRRNLFKYHQEMLENHLSPSLPVYIKLTWTVQV